MLLQTLYDELPYDEQKFSPYYFCLALCSSMRIFTASSKERSFPSLIVCSAAIFNNALLVSSLIFNFLFIIEHPRFEKFYQNLRNEGYLIGIGDTSNIKATGDIIPIDAIPSRVPDYDIAWPVQIYEQGSFPDLDTIEVSRLPRVGIS